MISSDNSPLSQTFFSGLSLQVHYRERSDAARIIPHNFLRRDLRVTEKEVLASRCIDRSLRPLFPKGYSDDTQVCLLCVAVVYCVSECVCVHECECVLLRC